MIKRLCIEGDNCLNGNGGLLEESMFYKPGHKRCGKCESAHLYRLQSKRDQAHEPDAPSQTPGYGVDATKATILTMAAFQLIAHTHERAT